jgi:signal transduction histidine kinase
MSLNRFNKVQSITRGHTHSGDATIIKWLGRLMLLASSALFLVLEIVGFSRLYRSEISDVFWILGLGGIFWLGGLVGYWKQAKPPQQFIFWMFYLLNLVYGIFTICIALEQVGAVFGVLENCCKLVLLPLLAHILYLKARQTGYYSYMAKAKPFHPSRLLGLWYLVSFMMLLGLLASNLLLTVNPPTLLINSYYSGILLVFLGWLIRVQQTCQNALLRIQVQMLILSLAVVVLPKMLVVTLPRLLFGQVILDYNYLLPLNLILSIAFYYSFSQKTRLTRLELRLNLGLLISLSFAVAVMVCQNISRELVSIGLAARVSQQFLLMLISMLVTLIIYLLLQSRLKQLVDYIIYGSNYKYPEVLQELTTYLSQIKSASEMGQVLCNRLNTILKTTGVALLIKEKTGQLSQIAGVGLLSHIATDEVLQMTVTLKKLLSESCNADLLLKVDHSSEELLGRPISFRDELLGLLVLGSKLSGDRFSSTDLNLLAVLSMSVGAAIENSQLLEVVYQQLNDLKNARDESAVLGQQLAQVQDQQREELAYQLHDNVLQNLIFIARHSSFCADLLPTESTMSKRVVEQLHYLNQIAEESIRDLRGICSGLYPIIVDTVGLVGALHWLSQETQQLHGLKISLVLKNISEDQRWPHLIERNLFLIVQETINNCVKHALAKQLLLKLEEISDNSLIFEAHDNGQGMAAAPNLGQLAAQGHQGLAAMRLRTQRLNGQLEIESLLGVGTMIRVVLPTELLANVGNKNYDQ